MNPILATPKEYSTNLFVININLYSSKESKLYLKATEGLPRADRVTILLSASYLVWYYLEAFYSKFTWRLLLSQVLDNNDNNNKKNDIKNY